jgi:hypothetical protein
MTLTLIPPPRTRNGAIARALVVAAVFLVATPGDAISGPVDLTFTTPTNTTFSSTVTVMIGDAKINAVIAPGTSSGGKRDAIVAAIAANKAPKFDVKNNGAAGLTISNLAKGTKVTFDPRSTGEAADKAVASLSPTGAFGFANAQFATKDSSGASTVFTGGVVTSFGQLVASVSASDFGNVPSLSGTMITGALFDLLAPSASAFGVSLSLNGDSIGANFDLTKTSNNGVVFGTTALTEGAFGQITVGDGVVPEPSSLALSAIAGLSGLAYARRGRKIPSPD